MKMFSFAKSKYSTMEKVMSTSSEIAVRLEPVLRPLYQELMNSVKHIFGKKYAFAVQWGDHYPSFLNKGILFVGRATNKWHTTEEDLEVLFGDPQENSTIFNCDDQMTWVNDCARGEKYQTNRSAFWRVIREVSKSFYPEDELNHVAWSNVCKIQKEGGKNPEGRFFDSQIETCQKIFKAEMDVLSPKFVIMLVGGYGKREILTYMNCETMPDKIETRTWDIYKADVYKIDETVYVCSEHPMGKNEREHIECLKSIVSDYM